MQSRRMHAIGRQDCKTCITHQTRLVQLDALPKDDEEHKANDADDEHEIQVGRDLGICGQTQPNSISAHLLIEA